MYFWKFKIEAWEEEIGSFKHEGLIYGANMTDAVDRLENWYGDDIINLYLECVGEKDEPYLLDKQYKINEGGKMSDERKGQYSAQGYDKCRF